VSGGVHRYLVTGDQDAKWAHWQRTAYYANWIEGRENGDRETWLVTCYDDTSAAFLEAAGAAGATVEEIHGAGESESYELCVGPPGSGWKGGKS
jgi:hypothetical protein